MKIKTLAFLYNVRHKYPDPNDPRTQLEADFDDPETTDWQIRHLKNCGYKVIPIEADETAYLKLYKNKSKIDLAFNVSEGIYGKDREAHLPAMLEMLQIAYTGSSPLTQALVLNKAKTKEVLMGNNIPTLAFRLYTDHSVIPEIDIKYPIIVKPVAEGSSAGISNNSVVYNKSQLDKQVKYILKTFRGEPALVEAFLSGQEYSIAMIGNPPKILPIIEPVFSMLPKKYLPLDSLEVKWIFEEQGHTDYLRCPAGLNKKLKQKIEEVCLNVWKALNIQDWCRIDLRLDNNGNPYILEVNSPPGILPPEISQTSYFPLAARKAGIEYEEMMKIIINSAVRRYTK